VNNQQYSDAELEGLTWLMRLTYENPSYGLYAYLVLVLLAIIVFNLGFAQKLPVLKKVVVYIGLMVGCFVLWFLEFAFGAPMMVVLIISGIILGIYRFRLHLHRKEKQNEA
jgi:hypothetical protein